MTATRKPATKRATATRKKTAANGQTNGAAPGADLLGGNGQSVLDTVRPPEEYILREETTAEVEPTLRITEPPHPYGDRAVQVFEPTEGTPIIVPHISGVDVTELFLWEMEKRGLDLMHQSWAWLDHAQIPTDIQRRIIGLPAPDKRRFWNEWFGGFVPPPTSEPPGES